MDLFIIISIIATMLYICYTDVRYRFISNSPIILLATLSVCLVLIADYSFNFIAAFGLGLLGLALVYLKIVDLSDIKLLIILGSLFSTTNLLIFLFFTLISGLLISMLLYIQHKFQGHLSLTEIPYSVAITAGYLLTLLSI